jgi:hypothetical protein
MVKKLTREQILAQIPAARAAGKAAMKEPWWPVHVEWVAEHDAVLIGTKGGISFLVPRSRIKEIKKAEPEQLVAVDLAGEGIRWEELDVDLSVRGLLADALGPSFSTRAAGAIGGRARTKAKAAAARANGAKGGRPRKHKAR